MIRLQDLLQFSHEDMKRTKLKFNQWNGEDILQAYLSNPERVNNLNLFWRNNNSYFQVGQLAINFVQITRETWLLTTIKEVTEDLGVKQGQGYLGQELDRYKPYYGRLVIRYRKPTRHTALWYESCADQLEVVELLPEIYNGEAFPGYDNVCISHQKLEDLIRLNNKEWQTALSHQKAVYLITDRSNGKHYVGSATSERGMLFDRWSAYIATGHGGNKELVELVKDKGIDHVKQHFYYSLLENYNARVSDDFILSRESWWKKVLQSRAFGYNQN